MLLVVVLGVYATLADGIDDDNEDGKKLRYDFHSMLTEFMIHHSSLISIFD